MDCLYRAKLFLVSGRSRVYLPFMNQETIFFFQESPLINHIILNQLNSNQKKVLHCQVTYLILCVIIGWEYFNVFKFSQNLNLKLSLKHSWIKYILVLQLFDNTLADFISTSTLILSSHINSALSGCRFLLQGFPTDFLYSRH